MPIIKSAIKRVKQTNKRTARNVRVKRELKATTKALEAAITTKDKKLPELLNKLQSSVDIAVKKNLIHKNKAARIKSRYALLAKDAGFKAVKSSKAKSTIKKTVKPAVKVKKKTAKK
jgi:ribosomal protein S20